MKTKIGPSLLHQDNMPVCFIPPYTPLLYSKTGVYKGLHYFLIFALKHVHMEKSKGTPTFSDLFFMWIHITAKPSTKPENLFHLYEIWKNLK